MPFSQIGFVRPHDLLEIFPEALKPAKERDERPAPAWVQESLSKTPFVVVRRGVSSEATIPVGVRGAERNQRWAASLPTGSVKRVITPPELMEQWTGNSSRDQEITALAALKTLQSRWKEIAYPWGPGGSVGFELATGTATAKAGSDLDVLIYADHPFSIEWAQWLGETIEDLPVRVDLLVETPTCGFSFHEYLRVYPRRLLLRTPHGSKLGSDPWNNSLPG